jgi:outer membrane protein assembly factor BamB
MKHTCLPVIAVAVLVSGTGTTPAADWPMWRYDAYRSAASPQQLPASLYLHWVRELPPLKPAWPDQPKMQLDAVYEPIVLGQTLYVGSSVYDAVIALDTQTGAEKWKFFADGPVRFAPVGWEGKLYFAADDGYLYCLDAERGTLLWKFRGGPSERKVLGNERLVSTWPARGAPVLADGIVYFAASIWPFMGVFIHALDARSGEVVWTNDGDGATFMKQPHGADAFAGVAPQGPLVVAGDYLLIPGGRSIPALYDRKTGRMLRYLLAENSKRGGGSAVSAGGNVFLNGGAVFELASQKFLGAGGELVVPTADILFTASSSGSLKALDLKNAAVKTVETKDKKGNPVKLTRWTADEVGAGRLPVGKGPTGSTSKLECLIQSGSRLYGGSPGLVAAVDLPLRKETQTAVSWQASVPGTPASLVAADDRLFVVTREGQLLCFGPGQRKAVRHALPKPPDPPLDAWTRKAHAILDGTGVRQGYAVAWGVGSGRLVSELARQSDLRLIVIEPDEKKANAFRDQLIAAQLLGTRVEVHVTDPLSVPLPPYLASLMVSENLAEAGIEPGRDFVDKVFASLRPFGGVACLPPTPNLDVRREVAALGLEQARVNQANGWVYLVREGALPGSANWTHEHADAANTRVSRDRLVKAPLGVLWFGGPSHDGILPRHGHGPQPQVVDGRLFIEGIDMLRCMDIYTGRILWETSLPGVGAFYNNTAHQPGANAAGTNFVSSHDGIYVVYGQSCLRLDPATGKEMARFRLPILPGMKDSPRWGYLNVVGDFLIGGADPLFDPNLFKPVLAAKPDDDDKKSDADPPGAFQPEQKKPAEPMGLLGRLTTALSRGANDNLSSSRHLVVMDRHSGKVLWSVSARYGFRHNGVCAGGGRLYCIDRLSGPELVRMKRRGEEPRLPPRLLVFDLQTGKELWSSEEDVFGTWLSYSAEHDVLVESGRRAGDTLNDEPAGMRAYRAASGQVMWKKDYSGPAMLHGQSILMAGKACNLLTGEPKMREDPITGQPVEWTWMRTYGCNTPAASEHLLTFRSGAAGFFDLCHDGGTGNFGGFRSSCTNNLVVAGGILTAPDYTRTCVCSYQNQTSLALVHMPELEIWTYFGTKSVNGPVRRVGINLGAPGDRRAADGTLWLEYPAVGGVSPPVPVAVAGKPDWFRRHSSLVSGPMNWVAASGVKGASSITVTLDKDADLERTYTVRLYFVEPDQLKAGQRRFSVSLQGKEVVQDLDIARETGGAKQALVKEFKGIQAGKELNVRLVPTPGAAVAVPVLCGIEIIAEGW